MANEHGRLEFMGVEVKVGDPITEHMLWWMTKMAKEERERFDDNAYWAWKAHHDLGLPYRER
jgi:hypothetical protein